jgi:hypothetical protein
MTTSPFAEDHLPEGQSVIETKNVKRCRSFIRLIADPKRRSPTMGVITGLAGVGKTIARVFAFYITDAFRVGLNRLLPMGSQGVCLLHNRRI